MNWLLDVHMLESCASLVSQFLAMSFQPQKQLPSGKGCCFLEKLTCKKAMSHLMDNQYSLQEACVESTLNGGATWHTVCIGQYKAGFGARVLPTMRKPVPKSVAFDVPLGPIEESALHDKDAEAVIQFAIDEQKVQEEQLNMSANDPLSLALREKLGEAVAGELDGLEVVDDDGPAVPSGPMHVTAEIPPLTNVAGGMSGAPPRDYIEVESPREAAASRPSEHPDEESSKRQRVEESKRQRVSRLQAEYEQRLCAVRIAYKEYFTMDDYETDLNIEEPMEEDDDWVGEDTVVLTGIPEELWSDAPTDQPAPGIPEKRIDDLADKVEIQCLCSVQVLVPQSEFQG